MKLLTIVAVLSLSVALPGCALLDLGARDPDARFWNIGDGKFAGRPCNADAVACRRIVSVMANPESKARILAALDIGKAIVCRPGSVCDSAAVAREAIKQSGVVDLIDLVDLTVVAASEVQ